MKVTVTANPNTNQVFNLSVDEKGQPKLDKNGNRYGFVRLESESLDLNFMYNDGGLKKRSALRSLTESAWENVKHIMTPGAKFDGKIIVKESLEQKPGYQLKKSGEDGVTCTLGGMPIYRTTEFTTDLGAQDELIKHDNTEEIKAAVATAKGVILNED
jgi:hypothetical protein